MFFPVTDKLLSVQAVRIKYMQETKKQDKWTFKKYFSKKVIITL